MNTIESAVIFQEALDIQMLEGSTTGWMEQNAGRVKYNGGAEVKIPKLAVSGLANYSRSEGYPNGAVDLSYQTVTLTQDRGVKFRLDSMDVDESNFIAEASNVLSEFQRSQVIPEVDAYRYSRISRLAKDNSKEYTPAASTILSALRADITAVREIVGDNVELVICMNHTAAGMFDTNDKLQRTVNVGEFKQGKVSIKVKYFDEIPIIRVPSSRMKTKYVFNDGKTSGQEDGGFTPADDAVQINWIIMPRKSPIAVSKTDKVKIINPEVNQSADAWDVDYRKFHDLWMKDSDIKATRVSVQPAAASASTSADDPDAAAGT